MPKFFWDLELLSWKINVYEHVLQSSSENVQKEWISVIAPTWIGWTVSVPSWRLTLKKHISRNRGPLKTPSRLSWRNYMDLLLILQSQWPFWCPGKKKSTYSLGHRVLPPLCTDQRENCNTHSHSKTFIFIYSHLLAENYQNDCISSVTKLEFIIIIIIFAVKQLSLQGEI